MAKDKANSFFANVVACVRYLCNVAKARFNAFQKAIDVPIDEEKNPPFVMIGGGQVDVDPINTLPWPLLNQSLKLNTELKEFQ